MRIAPEEAHRLRQTLRALCDDRTLEIAAEGRRVIFHFQGTTATVVEQRPRPRKRGEWAGRNVAKLTFQKSGRWELSYRGDEDRWVPFEPCPSAVDFADLVQVVREDATGIFWERTAEETTRPAPEAPS